ncbi:MAG TPA: hypothetical protein ENK37_08160 [Oceanithermus profundus]|uniref:Uncharacterized protein n=1 Tax=Oceanithermus profundus TaxID=187137 RepID=A0A7C4V6F5_9DEIN|nr:hypothetical protein [Oceanithermus profundus]
MADHTFHIPVMGTAFTVDTPLKIAKYGIASVISIVDDDLLERMRGYWSRVRGRSYEPIAKDLKADSRARRTAAYLDLVDELVAEDFASLQNAPLEPGSELWRYLALLPAESPLRRAWERWRQASEAERAALEREIRAGLAPGRVEVNVMTKVDKPNFVGREPLPVEYNDAHAALRGFAESTLEGVLVLSAGFNARLYSYMANFAGFFADEAGRIKKQITLKVSDARSALTQGKFLAKKGLWVSEYRVESGLNCGGHAFASQGYLMGPILEELKSKRDEIVASLFEIYKKALEKLGRPVPSEPPEVRITAQGGVGTAEEHAMLRERYGLDSVGWGSPFLLVPEVTVVDERTRRDLSDAGEDDLYLSGASPLGVPFNVLRNASMVALNRKWYEEGKPGSPCPKGHLEFNTEFTEKPICTASRNYQYRKIQQLQALGLSEEVYRREIEKLLEKQCLCTGLAEPAHLEFHLEPQMKETGVSICPGPNLAYFSGERALEEMVDHIYGRRPLELEANRPHVFIKELRLYADYLRRVIAGEFGTDRDRTPEAVAAFRANLAAGARYYLERLGELGLGPWKDELENYAAQPA